jgi:hypothetical protein
MDVLGNDPSSKEGEYFCNNISWWHPLATYCCNIAPDITKYCKHWHSNDGDGLNNALSLALADRLDAELAGGRAHLYARAHHVEHREPCRVCESTGAMRAPVGMVECFVCAGTGYAVSNTFNPFTVENLRRFVTFLRGCGGFKIW